jgi:DNA-3-methyladenine glycosylase
MKPSRRAATLPVAFFDRNAATVARELLGAVVVSTVGGERAAGRIVETEAYLGYDDPASHGYLERRNQRNAALFGPPGTWYVYLSYGMHWCTNLVCEEEGRASAVLLRALEPLEGLETMRRRRGMVDDRELCSGPGKLCQALGITRALDGMPMAGSPVLVLPAESTTPGHTIVSTPRIGITKAADWPLRFVLEGNGFVSGRRRPARG